MNDWWPAFYDATFADVFLATTSAESSEDAAQLLFEALHLAPGDLVFDQCCGTGRIALPLALRGVRVLGVDASAEYVARGLRDAARLDARCELVCGDAFDFTPREPCKGAFNWATSFGYTDDDAQNARMLARAFEALVPGGRFALDYYATPFVLREFKDRMESRHVTPTGEVLLVRDARIDFARGLLDQTWTYLLPDGARVVRSGATRLYMPHELVAMLARAGFVDVALLGDTGGRPFDGASTRCIVLGTKPRTTE